METVSFIDSDAKLKIPLHRISKDVSGLPYYVGKLQFPGELHFNQGLSFMVFVSEEGYEEVHIGPINLNKRKARSNVLFKHGRICVDLHPVKDREGELFYVGEAVSEMGWKLDCLNGLFFTIFTSREGSEEIQISKLEHKPRKDYNNQDENDEDDEEENE